MKRFLAILVAIIMLSSFGEAEASHIWESDYDGFNYTVYENGGDFVYYSAPGGAYHKFGNTGVPPAGETSLSFSTPAATTNDEFVSPPGSMSLHGMAGGNLIGDDTTVVKAYAGIDFTSEIDETDHFNAGHHGVQVRQNVAASIQRIFRVDIDGYCDFAGAITGPVEFNTFNNLENHYAEYQLTGNVSILEFRENTGGVASSATIALNDQMRNDAIEGFPVFAPQGTGKDIYYKLYVSLLLNTEVQNIDYKSFESFALNGPFQLGDGIDDPLVLTASMSTRAVPIPGTVFLLFSGLGGLTLMRRRFLRT